MGNIRSRLVKGALWIGIARGLSSTLGAISTVVLARLLNPADFGIAAIAMATLSITMALTEMSLASALIAKDSYEHDHIHAVWTLSLARSTLIVLGFVLAAPKLAEIYHDPRLAPVLIITGITGALTGLYNPRIALKSKELAFKQQFYIQFMQKALTFAASVTLAILLKSYWALVLSGLVASAVTCFCSYFITPYVPRIRIRDMREMFSFSIWLSLSQGLRMLNWRFDQLLVGYFLSKASLGLYAVADGLAATPIREAMQPLAQTLFPGFTKLRHDPAAMKRGFRLAQSMLALVAFPVALGFACVAEPLVHLAIGHKWAGAIPIIQILCLSQGVQALSLPLQGLAMAQRETRRLFWRDLRGFVLRIPLGLAGLYWGGLLGLIWSRTAVNWIGVLFNMRIVREIIDLPVRTQIKDQWRTALASLTMVAIVRLIDSFALEPIAAPDAVRLVVMIAAGALSYSLAILLLWRAAGKPDATAEAELTKVLQSILARATSRRRAS